MSGKRKFTVISLFAGCGGSSLGYQHAGFSELLAVDLDTRAMETFKLNFDIPAWQKDIRKVKGKDILAFCNVKKGEIDLLDGSPPCQGFSVSGKKQITDKRNDLIYEFIRLARELQPKVFIMENVPGMIEGKIKGLFIEYMRAMKKLNYNVKCKLMNAMYYQVPQSRKRVIFIGVRKDVGSPAFPKPNRHLLTAEEVIGKLKNQKVPTGKTQKLKDYWDKANYGETVGKWGARRKLNPHKPAPVLQASRANYHYSEPRSLSALECALLQTFPRSFKWTGNYYERIRQIGNAVPPKFMKAIAGCIKTNVLAKAT